MRMEYEPFATGPEMDSWLDLLTLLTDEEPSFDHWKQELIEAALAYRGEPSPY